MRNKYSQRMDAVFKAAKQAARDDGHNMLGSEHLLLGLIAEGGRAAQMLTDVGVTRETVLPAVRSIVGRGLTSPSELPHTPHAEEALDWASNFARIDGKDTEPEHLLQAILMNVNSSAVIAIRLLDVDLRQFRRTISSVTV